MLKGLIGKVARPVFRGGLMVLLVVALNVVAASPAQALLITTEFVFIGPKKGVGTFVMKNTSDQQRAFRMNWQEVVMDAEGRRITLDSVEAAQDYPGVLPASPYVYMAPRRMMIQPDEVQSVRFMARRTQNMAPGEYRSYLEIRPEEIPGAYVGEEVEIPTDQKGVNLNMKLLTGLRVPVFVLNGETTLEFGFEDIHVSRNDRNALVIEFTAVRNGTRSALGTIDIRCSKADGRTKYMSRGTVKIFTEVNRRRLSKVVPEGELAECVSPLILAFTPHKEDPAYNDSPLVSAQVPF